MHDITSWKECYYTYILRAGARIIAMVIPMVVPRIERVGVALPLAVKLTALMLFSAGIGDRSRPSVVRG